MALTNNTQGVNMLTNLGWPSLTAVQCGCPADGDDEQCCPSHSLSCVSMVIDVVTELAIDNFELNRTIHAPPGFEQV